MTVVVATAQKRWRRRETKRFRSFLSRASFLLVFGLVMLAVVEMASLKARAAAAANHHRLMEIYGSNHHVAGKKMHESPSEEAARHVASVVGVAGAVLKIQPLYGQHRNHSDAVLAMATGLTLPVFVMFTRSLLKSGYDGDIVFGIDAQKDLPLDVREFLEYHAQHHHLVAYEIDRECILYQRAWTLCKVLHMFADPHTGEYLPDRRPHRHLSQMRFDYYWAWSMQYSSDSRIFLMDTRDLYFQRNPFSLLPPGAVMQSTLIVFEESKIRLLGEESNNRMWIRRSRGEEWVKALAHRGILCAGTTVGGQRAIETYTRTMIQQLDVTNCTEHGCDQGHHNFLVLGGFLEGLEHISQVQVQKQGHGLINTLALLSRHGGPLRSRGILDNTTGNVLNEDGSISAVVHQFDREPELVAIVQKLVNTLTVEWRKLRGKTKQ